MEELLDFSRIQNGRFTLQMANIDIIAELDDALLIYTDKARKENKTIHYTEPEFLCVVYGDKNRLRQVFINVIDNAIKYSDPGGSVDISVEKGTDTLTITVADTGIGIAAAGPSEGQGEILQGGQYPSGQWNRACGGGRDNLHARRHPGYRQRARKGHHRDDNAAAQADERKERP